MMIASAGLAVSACSVINPEQALTVTTDQPSAEVYLALHGRRSIGVNATGVIGSIPAGQDNTEFVFIGETPLEHSFYTTRHQHGVMVPGEFSSNQSTVYSEATVQVVYDDGARDERRIRLNNDHISLHFDGPGEFGPISRPK